MEPEPRPETSASVRYQRRLNNCPKCKGYSKEKPCLEWAEILREEFMIYIDGLFHRKMKEFSDFIEEVVDVDDQVDPDQNNIIHAFYREHNTLHKMNENFRLLEYKRKKYVEAAKER